MSSQRTGQKEQTSLIEMREGQAGKRACVAGTRIDVWLIVRAFQDCAEDFGCLADVFDMLTADQLRAALNYYSSHTDEIDRWIESIDSLTEEKTRQLYPELFKTA